MKVQTIMVVVREREKRHRKQEFDIFERVHEPDYKYMQRPVNPVNGKPIEPEHKLEVNIEQDNFTEEKYALFAHYQEVVHKEPPSRISEGGFRGFLCSGMHQGTFAEGGRERKIGSFHQCYRIDGRLVALGVLDLMPHCVSSVYLIYHQDFNRWEFGKLSALREIAMAIEEGYRYYYMGYYIHSCTKMKYKRDFRPTYVLDPESYEWNLFDEDLLTRLNSRKYVSLSRERRLGIASTATDPEEKGAAKQNYEQNLFSSRMPGITTPEDIMANLRTTDLRIMHRKQVVALGGMPWVLEDMHDPRKLQGVLADFVACVGIENVKDWVLALSHIFGDEDE
ncbi:MAG: hypothetical protein LQ340_006532 [Diploschistes diacapsis]|nr:MAG: hypothetical protein LQ340_006532 [Diploschistes diacapsis]